MPLSKDAQQNIELLKKRLRTEENFDRFTAPSALRTGSPAFFSSTDSSMMISWKKSWSSFIRSKSR